MNTNLISFRTQVIILLPLRFSFFKVNQDAQSKYSYFGARYYDSDVSMWLSVDRFTDKYPSLTPYQYAGNNPINLIDINGDSVWLYATTLPGSDPSDKITNKATHTFLVVDHDDGTSSYYAFGPDGDKYFGSDRLTRQKYSQDMAIQKGEKMESLRAKILIDVPDGMNSKEFDQKVSRMALSFGNNPDIKYDALTLSKTTGNCNSSTSTILSKAGVSSKN